MKHLIVFSEEDIVTFLWWCDDNGKNEQGCRQKKSSVVCEVSAVM